MRQKLYKLRKEKGFTQKNIAKSLGISRRMYGSIETGSRNPSWKVAQRLEQFFNIPASELLAEGKEENASGY